MRRRRFLQTMSGAAALPLVGGVLPVLAQTPAPASPPPTVPASPPGALSSAPATDPGVAADARTLLEVVKRRWGDRLEAKQLDAVREDIEGNLDASAALRKLALTNADEPDVIFHAEPPREA